MVNSIAKYLQNPFINKRGSKVKGSCKDRNLLYPVFIKCLYGPLVMDDSYKIPFIIILFKNKSET